MALSMRQAFEAEYQPQEGVHFEEASSMYFGGSNITALTMLNVQWAAWQKAWELSRLNLVVAYPATGGLLSPGFNAAVNQCRAAVESACGQPSTVLS
ncbi:TPA: hypothetical protein NIA45_004687 [Pseudomonas aeruginosa]|nr:hypothetical protein [Pseudomonas aeruginosa]